MKQWVRVAILIAAPYLAVMAVMIAPGARVQWRLPPPSAEVLPCPGARGAADSSKRLPPLSLGTEPLALRGWKRMVFAPFVLETNIAQEDGEKLAGVLTAALRSHERMFGSAEGVYRVRCFARRHEFVAYARRLSVVEADSLYVVQTDEIVLCKAAMGTLYANAVHELNHQFVRRKFRTRETWLLEGLAEYMGAFEVSDGVLVPGRVDRDRLAAARRALSLGLRSILVDPKAFYAPGGIVERYALSWLVVHYLAQKQPELLRAHLEGRPGTLPEHELSLYLDLLERRIMEKTK